MTETPPGAQRAPELSAALDRAYAALGPDWRPRTEHVGPVGARWVNRLIREPSPYLRQHAHNPVDWRPWGDEAMAEAAALNRPIFLSVGYATCHWCHVMEEESFDDVEVAELLNARFIPVKLDREQRPDLDQIYILATQIQNGHAGWPNSVWLTPEGAPFHTGTYFPKPRFLQVLVAVDRAWTEKRDEVEKAGEEMSSMIRRLAAPQGAGALDRETAPTAAGQLVQTANMEEGGFSKGTQFPQETFLLFLLDHWRRTGDKAALGAATSALDGIAAGGIHDHVGGGFHRYAVDVNWRTPHFEKMLYNQALLSRAFLQGWAITGRAAWARAAERCFAYVLREMTSPEGAFYAAEDADNLDAEGRRSEGDFYVWTPEAAQAALGPDAPFAIAALGLEEPPTLEAGPVAHLRHGASVDYAALDPILDRMRDARAARNRPIRDDKIIAGWNGLMIRALAEGAAMLGRPDLAEAAARAYDAALSALRRPGGLARIAVGDDRREDAGLEDRAWLGLAALALWDATGEARWLAEAEAQAAALSAYDHQGAMKMTVADGPLGPTLDTDDGATPSGQSSALELLARLNARAPDPARAARARDLLGALAPNMAQRPTIRTLALTAAAILETGETEPVRALGPGAARLFAQREGEAVTLTLKMTDGWKLAADTFEVTGLADLAQPAPEAAEPAPGMPAMVYAGSLTLTGRASAPEVTLNVQFCDDRSCALPQIVTLRLD